MGILNYINEKKAKLKELQSNRRMSNLQSQEMKLKELDKERLRLADEVRLNNAVTERQKSIQNLKKQKFASSGAGRIIGNIKEKMNESKKQNSGLFGNTNSNPFTSGSVGNGNIFTQTKPISKPITRRKR